MARPKIHHTEEERKTALRASWQKYNQAHKAERAAHNRAYSLREDVKQRRKELREIKKMQSALTRYDDKNNHKKINQHLQTCQLFRLKQEGPAERFLQITQRPEHKTA